MSDHKALIAEARERASRLRGEATFQLFLDQAVDATIRQMDAAAFDRLADALEEAYQTGYNAGLMDGGEERYVP